MTAKVVVVDQAFGGVAHERAMAEEHGAEFAEHDCRTEAETVEAARGADVLFVNFAPVTAAVLDVLAPGAIVVRYGVGYDNVDVPAARERGIAVANVPDYGVETVADHTVTLLLTLLRRIGTYTAGIRSEGWVTPGSVGPIASFADTTVGLVGTGRIGRQVAERLKPFGFRVIAYDPFVTAASLDGHIRMADLDTVLAEADALTLHCPLTPENHHLIGSETLARMKPGAFLVNTSRGGLVDAEAVADALGSGRLRGVAFDVFEPEPLAADSPLRAHPNALFTPHAAFYSTRSLDNLQRLAAEEAGRALRHEALRCPVT